MKVDAKIIAHVVATTANGVLIIKPLEVAGYGKASEITKLFEDIEAYLMKEKGLKPEAKPRRRLSPRLARLKRLFLEGVRI